MLSFKDVPTRGYIEKNAPVRAFALQYRIDLDALANPETFAASLRAYLDRYVQPYRKVGQKTLLVFPENMGMLSALVGEVGAQLPAVHASLPAPDPASPAAQLLGLVGEAAASLAGLEDGIGGGEDGVDGVDASPSMFFVAAADAIGKNFCELFSDLAREYDAYVVTSAYMPFLETAQSGCDGGVSYEAAGAEVYNQTMLWAPYTVDETLAPWEQNLLFTNLKVPLTQMEEVLLGITPGSTTGQAAKENASFVEIEGLKLGFATSLPAFAYGYDFGKKPEGFDPLADMAKSYAAAGDALGVDVMIQCDANAGLWCTYLENGSWQPLEWMGSTYRAVADPTVGYRYNITPMLTGNLLDLPFDGQSSITARDGVVNLRGTGAYVGNSEPFPVDSAYPEYMGAKENFLALAPWVSEDLPREALTQIALSLLPGLGSPNQDAYVETAIFADLVPAGAAVGESGADAGADVTGASAAQGTKDSRNVQVIAHRGNSSALPEHSLSAYRSALASGAHGIEIDLQLTGDNQAICFHDPILDRTTTGSGPVVAHTVEQIRELDLLRPATAEAEEISVPARTDLLTLDQILDLCLEEVADKDTFTLVLELKHPNPRGLELDKVVIETLKRRGYNEEMGTIQDLRISLMSFNPESFMLAKELGMDKNFCLLIADIDPDAMAAELGVKDPAIIEQVQQAIAASRNLLGGAAVEVAGPSVQYLEAHPEEVRVWNEAGVPMRVWTVDTKEQVETAIAAGASQLTTNHPHRVLRWLA